MRSFESRTNSTNKTAATLTIGGAGGRVELIAAFSPASTDTAPTIAAMTAIIFGVRLNGRATAAGMINMPAISSTPTTLIATATTMASDRVRTSCLRL